MAALNKRHAETSVREWLLLVTGATPVYLFVGYQILVVFESPTFITPLDASGGSVFRIMTGPAMLE